MNLINLFTLFLNKDLKILLIKVTFNNQKIDTSGKLEKNEKFLPQPTDLRAGFYQDPSVTKCILNIEKLFLRIY